MLVIRGNVGVVLFAVGVCCGVGLLAQGILSPRWVPLDDVSACRVTGGAVCYDTEQKDCPENPGACGDQECQEGEVGYVCPEMEEGTFEYKENYSNCIEKAQGEYEDSVTDEDFFCWKKAFCRRDNCIQATNGKYYCSNGPNTPEKVSHERDECKEGDNNRCPPQTYAP